ncbi:unnamed protein product, partial [Effrenium voratum]
EVELRHPAAGLRAALAGLPGPHPGDALQETRGLRQQGRAGGGVSLHVPRGELPPVRFPLGGCRSCRQAGSGIPTALQLAADPLADPVLHGEQLVPTGVHQGSLSALGALLAADGEHHSLGEEVPVRGAVDPVVREPLDLPAFHGHGDHLRWCLCVFPVPSCGKQEGREEGVRRAARCASLRGKSAR